MDTQPDPRIDDGDDEVARQRRKRRAAQSGRPLPARPVDGAGSVTQMPDASAHRQRFRTLAQLEKLLEE